jgi:hypothetical protein
MEVSIDAFVGALVRTFSLRCIPLLNFTLDIASVFLPLHGWKPPRRANVKRTQAGFVKSFIMVLADLITMIGDMHVRF